jgi:hypothetical protein
MLKRTIRWIMPVVVLLLLATYLVLSTAVHSHAAGATYTIKQHHTTVSTTATPAVPSGGFLDVPDYMGGH